MDCSKRNTIRNLARLGTSEKTQLVVTLPYQLHLELLILTRIERRTGADIAWVFDLEGEEGFRLREESVIGDLTEMQGIVPATGGGSVMSKEVRNKLSARGIVVYLETPIEKQVARTQRDKRRPLLQTEEAPRDVLERLAEEREPLYKEVADFCCTH
eukprot:TRINITY_DN1597_c0_g1_i1.p1 TRINITY_DN1597_c0_g1~~TRINITY_DN1597_c0_g1_i1.p1  ORF type:complete len:157 (-),score=26.37 TRINITY_DN1597_c0_g1_i1:45-515(-)